MAAEALSNVKFVQERKLICKFFENIAMDTGMVVSIPTKKRGRFQ